MKRKKKMSKISKSRVSNEDFVKAWQSAVQFSDVLKVLSVKSSYASARATSLRRQNVQLKRFKRSSQPIDVKGLNELAKKSLKN